MRIYAIASARAVEAWAQAQSAISTLEAEKAAEKLKQEARDNELITKINELKQYCRQADEIRKRYIAENSQLKGELLKLKEELQARDDIIDRISATHNPVLIAELVEGEGA